MRDLTNFSLLPLLLTCSLLLPHSLAHQIRCHHVQQAELSHYQTLSHDLNVKMEAMERMAEQASGVKMALSRRLEQLIVELKEVRGVATRLAQQVRSLGGKGA